jgi:hypothetical protein
MVWYMNGISAQNTALQSLDSSVYVDKMVLIQMNTMNNYYKTNFKVFKTNGLTKATKRDSQIEVNTEDIIEHTQFLDTSQLSTIVTLVIAHEFYHLLQYRFYNRPFTKYEPRIFESQADLLTGIYLFSRVEDKYDVSKDESLNNYGGPLNLAPIYRKAYSFFFSIGTNTFAKEEHPSKEQRSTSISRGILYGYAINLPYAFYNNVKKIGNKDTTRVINMIFDGFRKLNVPYDGRSIKPSSCGCYDSIMNFSQIMTWSYDQAKLIVHGNIENLVDIVRTNFELKGSSPNLITKSTYQNIGSDTLLFTFENRMGRDTSDTSAKYTNRNESNSFAFESRFLFENNAYHTIKLYPHNSVTITDTFSLKTFRQRNTSPPDVYSLFYCNSTQENIFQVNQNDLGLRQQFDQLTTLPNYIQILTDELRRNNLSKIIASMPNYKYDLKSGEQTVQYDGVVPLNSPFSCTIFRHLNTDKLNILLSAEFNNYSSADSFYLRCVKNLDLFFNQSNMAKTVDRHKKVFLMINNGEINRFKLYTFLDNLISINSLPISFKLKGVKHHNYYVSIDIGRKKE